MIAEYTTDQGITIAKKVHRLEKSDWKPIRPGVTKGIVGKALLPKGTKDVDVTVTRVEQGNAATTKLYT
ncbi:MAG: hypothetical protein ABSC55_17535 [Syntrophorhabdales bacterium]|jgi:hypothetical protein